MTIATKTKKEYEEKIKELRNKGFNIITFSKTLTEMEKDDKMVVIIR